MNAANEVAVSAFLDRRIAFPRIWQLVEEVMNRHTSVANPTLDAILDADRWAREEAAGSLIGSVNIRQFRALMFLHALRIIFILLEVIVLFNLLIVVHELGHFLAARWRGLVIEKFGVWFGKPLWKKTINGVRVFVRLASPRRLRRAPAARADGHHRGRNRYRSRQAAAAFPRSTRSSSRSPGPLFSLLLALVFAAHRLGGWSSGERGRHDDGDRLRRARIRRARKPALKPGDKILEVDGKRVTRFSGMNDSVIWNVIRSEGDTIPFVVERNGSELSFSVVPYKAPSSGWRRKSVRQVLIYPATTPVIDQVRARTRRQRPPGCSTGDIILGFNGTPIYRRDCAGGYVGRHPPSEFNLAWSADRNGSRLTLRPVPHAFALTKRRRGSASPGIRPGR